MIKEYFSLTSSERIGLFVVLLLLLGVLVFFKVRQLSYEPHLVDLSVLQDSVEQFYNSPLKKTDSSSYRVYSPYVKKTKPKVTTTKEYVKPKPLAVVELNGSTAKELTQIKGIGEFFAKGIVEHRERLGGFSNLDQLLSVYGMTEEKLELMKSQMSIDLSLRLPKVALNTADSLQLAAIYDVKPYVASHIVSYRNRLGGFYDSHQLLEISSIDAKLYHAIMERAVLDTIALRYLDINNSDFKAVLQHPYINGYENTKAIFRYLNYGAISDWEAFLEVPNLELDNADGLKHYLKFNPRILEPKE